ncbi:metallophosphoesterase family protein [Floccifex sp.]|uniref:metallophosphoesterase family protein n=1 Tax=Floccifex sp. TaxID=2815810 RepID=UPI003F061758
MKQLIVFSDAHGRKEIFPYLMKMYPNSPKICLGDSQITCSEYKKLSKDFVFVLGNCDFSYNLETQNYPEIEIEYRSSEELQPEEIVFTYEQVRFIACHGHHLYEDDFLYLKAWDANVLLTGHTHVFKNKQKNGRYSINPGSCNPYKVREILKDWSRKPSSYCVIQVENGKIIDVLRINCDKLD